MTKLPQTSSGTASVPVAAFPFAPGAGQHVAAMTTLAQQNQGDPLSSSPRPWLQSRPPRQSSPPFQRPSCPLFKPRPSPTVGFRTRGPWVAGALYTVVPTGPLLAIAEDEYTDEEGPTWYAITRGLYVGVTLSNALAVNAVVRVSGSNMRSFATQALALAAFNKLLGYNMIAIYNSASSHQISQISLPDAATLLNSRVLTSRLPHSRFHVPRALARLDLQDRSPATPPSRTPAHLPVPATRPPRTPSATARLPQTPSSDPPAYTLSASHAVPLAHSQTITNTSPTAGSTYYYESPTRRGCTTQWYRDSRVPGASVHTVSRGSPKPKTKKKAYVVFCGLRCGVIMTWPETQRLVKNVRNCIFCGYNSVDEAHAAFQYAQARSWTRIVNAAVVSPIPSLPQPLGTSENAHNPLNGSEVLDDRWFIVYRGIHPGVYRSHLECQLNTLGVPGSLHQSVAGKANALAMYAAAVELSNTGVVAPTYWAASTSSDPFL
ncbi:hypothetical protein B0H13DRAFT_1912885 [Mycena leptocephala]|nr:hypothetical protein B0H13DRAFT_1912885 [Mycena leptocephala]